MLAPEAGSTNSEVDKAPLMGSSFARKFSGFFSRSGNHSNSSDGQGYVEFGSINEQVENRTLGTFAGVFSPVTLSMFSALIFLRMGYIVGNAGLLVTLLQFVIAYAILVFTVASVCAISTNGAIEGGGPYFMISRTLGPEFGGAIGTLFFLANIVASGLYITGCVEGVIENFGPSGYLTNSSIPDSRWWQFLYCTGFNTLNLIVCLIGAGMFAKTTVFVLLLVCSSLAVVFFSFFYQGSLEVGIPASNLRIHNNPNLTQFGNYTGLSLTTWQNNLWSSYTTDYTSHDALVTFASVFGVLFSGVTGIMAGANMSGDLVNPSKSIPKGTLSAVSFTFSIYIGISALIAATCDKYLLQNNYLFLAGVSVFSASVAVGVLTATWSAALSTVIGGSRVLEALAKDRVFGSLLDFIPKGTWNGNPVAAVILSWALVQVVLLIGSLNVIAQLNSVLFLLSYLATNLACLGLELASAPNFRPTFKYFTWHTAFFGLIGTIVMMFVISPIYAACSILLCVTLVIGLHLLSPSREQQWGSISQALIFHQVRKYLLLLDSRKDHVKFWRPQVLLLVNSPRSACPLIDFINDLKKGGLYILGHVMTDAGGGDGESDAALDVLPHWWNLIDHLRVKAFVEVTQAVTVREGMKHLMRLSGMGAMKPNTVVLGFLDQQVPEDFLQRVDSSYKNHDFNADLFPFDEAKKLDSTEYVQMILDVLKMKKNLCLCRNFYKLTKDFNRGKQYIDVWPVNFLRPSENDSFDITSHFMMQLACIVNMVPKWRKLTLRICVCDGAIQGNFSLNYSSASHTEKLTALLKDLRIEADLFPVSGWTQVVQSQDGDSMDYLWRVNELILLQSSETAVTFIYLPVPHSGDDVVYLKKLEKISNELPPTIFVHGISTVTSTTL